MLSGILCTCFVGVLFWFGLGFFVCLFGVFLCAVNENKKNGGDELEALVGYFPRIEMCVNRKFPGLWSGLVIIRSWLLEDRPSSRW